ncbi:DUF456 domain-containing protein [Geobacter sp. 60473]|uniref:DUF456 domain-containing protein n=1 Tax=Geobacter sp. 60473 TaxID=3080755 RepID=UPI002B293AFA|nr:DUF456 family protein [Geobacter sp. 60473]
MTTALWLLAVVLVLIGIAGTLLPALPGIPLVFGGLVLAAWIDGFSRVGWLPLLVLGLFTAGSFAIDPYASGKGARRYGASRHAVIGASIGAVVGVFFGLPGLVAGPFLGASLGELLARGDLGRAGRAGIGAWQGFVIGTVLKVVLALAMVVFFLAAYLF